MANHDVLAAYLRWFVDNPQRSASTLVWPSLGPCAEQIGSRCPVQRADKADATIRAYTSDAVLFDVWCHEQGFAGSVPA